MIATVTLNPSLDEWVRLPAWRFGALNRAAHWARYPGGKGINVSRVVHELGGRTLAVALAGGEDGHILSALLRRLAIPHAFVHVAGTTRNNYKIQTARPRALTEINTEGPRASPTVVQQVERQFLRTPLPAAVALSGSLPPDVPATIYQRWIRLLRRQGTLTVLDASGEALRHGLTGRPWLVKPNRQEAEELLGRRLRTTASLVQAARELVRRGATHVVLSLGKEGAVLASETARDVWFAQPPTVRVDSAVGAGDSFIGGFLIGWLRRRSLPEALRLGTACGAATAMTPGTELCHRKDVERIVRRVIVRRAV